ncbi:MAG: hypothetical protein E6K84_04035 [Thaumarchaeota archaeon]|nr:MAG: hypothetical protein E6K84_04035 [Nitrososphaerota archaeon]
MCARTGPRGDQTLSRCRQRCEAEGKGPLEDTAGQEPSPRGSVKVYVHTRGDVVLEIAERTRLPKSYFRFRNLVEKHISEKSSNELIRVREMNIRELLRKVIKPDFVAGLSTQGKVEALEDLAETLVGRKNPCVVIGGFPHGHFSAGTLAVLDELARIHSRALDAHVVASRAVYEVEKRLMRADA